MLTLNDEQLAQYRRDGYIVVENVLSDSDVGRFLDLSSSGRDFPGGGLMGHKAHSGWRFLASHPNIVGPVRQIVGGPVKIVQTMYLDKPAKGSGIALHQDRHYLRNDPNTLMACWAALSDTDAKNGGLCVIPGSHTRGLQSAHVNEDTVDHVTWDAVHDMIDPDGRTYQETLHAFEIDNIDPASIVHLTVPRGAAVFFTGLTIHGSFANRSADRQRLAFATHYVHADTWLYRTDVHDTVPVG